MRPPTTHGSHTPAACSFPGANARSWAGLGEARPAQSSLSAGALCYRAWAQSWSSAGVELTRSFPVQSCKHPPAASLFSPAFRALGSKPGTKVTARSSLIMGWFPCAAALLGSPNAQGKPPQHIHLPLGGRTAPGKARSGRRFLGTNGATLWLWSCLPSQGHRDPDSLPAALSLGGEAPAWECSLGRFLSLGKSSPRGRLWQCAHPQPLSPLQGRLAPRSEGKARAELRHQSGTTHGSHTPAACSFPGANARSWAGLGEARPAQSSLSAGALCYRAWAQSWSSAGVEAHSVLPSTGLQAPAGHARGSLSAQRRA